MKILLIRPNRNEVDAQALANRGISSVSDPYLTVISANNIVGAKKMAQALREIPGALLIATSTNALPFFQDHLPEGELEDIISQHPTLRFAAIGAQTASQLHDLGARNIIRAEKSYGDSLAEVLTVLPPTTVVIPSGSIAMKALPESLTQAGFTIISEVVYLTDVIASRPPSLDLINAGEISAVLLRSPSAARAFHQLSSGSHLPAVCAGKTTASQALSLGLNVIATSDNPEPEAVAEVIAGLERTVVS